MSSGMEKGQWRLKTIQHLTIQSICLPKEPEELSQDLSLNVGVGMKTKETDVSQSCWGYMQMELKATDDFDEQAFHITVELRGLFNWDGSKELIEDLSDEQIKRELSPHAKETVNSLGQKMGYHGLIEPLMNI